MAITSITFIFIFLPATLLLYFILPKNNWRNGVLIIASLVFYGWTQPQYLPLLVAVLILDYFAGLLIDFLKINHKKTSARFFLWISVLLNLFPLIFFKYAGFIVESFSEILNLATPFESKILPLGISYFTFSGISYVLDIYNGSEKAQKNIIRFSTYLIMFPKLLQGPITRIGQIKNELVKPASNPDMMMQGARRFISGLSKKIILADSLGIISDKVFGVENTPMGAGIAWLGLLAFTMQIYFDFSGYTDMAIGLGKMIGLNLPENFNFPYVSRSITDFWRRWHMTLTSWFRNYVFIPLEFSRKHEKFLRQQSNILIVFLLTGLWHGAHWNFVLWGIYFGLILAIEASGFGKLIKKLPVIFQHIYAMGLVIIGWVFFRITDILSWNEFFKALLGGNGWATDVSTRSLSIISYIPFFVIGLLFITPIFSNLEKKVGAKSSLGRVSFDLLYISLFILSISLILAKGFDAFLYAQF